MTLVAERPKVGEPRDWRFPSFERREIGGGRMITCHLPGKPLAVVSAVFDAGVVTEPAGKEGVAELMTRALSEGTELRDAYEFAVAGERLGASWRSSSAWDSLRCGFEVPAGELAAATELLTEALRRPGFEPATLDRVRNERIDEIGLELSQPAARAREAFAGVVFDQGSRYSRPDAGTVASIAGITDDDIREHHRRAVSPERATLVVVGDLDHVDVDALGRRVFEGWSASAVDVVESPVVARPTGRRVLVVDRPGSVQSSLCVGHDGPRRKVDDYVALSTMAMVLGGMFGSRLNLKLREEKGYAYGAGGGFDCRKHGGLFASRSAVQSEVTVPALVDMVGEIERMHTGGVTTDELEAARAYRAGIFPLNFASALPVAAGLGDVVVQGFADDHFDRLRAQVLEVRRDELDAAALARLRPDDLSIVVVGDAAAFADELRAADLGPVEVVPDEV